MHFSAESEGCNLRGVEMGERCLHICTSETVDEIQCIADSHGWSLQGLNIIHITMPIGERSGPGQTMFYSVEIELPQIVEKLTNVIRDYDPQRVVIDSLSEVRLLARQESWYQRQLMILKDFLKPRACTVLLTDTVEEENKAVQNFPAGDELAEYQSELISSNNFR